MELREQKFQDTPVTFHFENFIISFIFEGIKQRTVLCFRVVLCGSEMCFFTLSGDKLQVLGNSAQENMLK